ncbi:conserved Plasmodium protein, unknown function [Plasmodium ovale]|nr:conserved Plasmodium protein, unknown function [Plasmodium ovale]
MDINLYVHSIEIEFQERERLRNSDEGKHEENIVYCLHIKVEDNLHEKDKEMKNEKFYETPWYMCIKNENSEMCMMSYEMNISYAFNLLENNERLILYVLRKNLENDKIEYIHRNDLNIKNKKCYDNDNCINFENDKVKGKIKLYLKNGIIYNHLLNKIKSDEFLKDVILKKETQCRTSMLSDEITNNIHLEKLVQVKNSDSYLSQNRCMGKDFNELLNTRRMLYWVYLDDDNNEQGPFNSKTIFNWIVNDYFEDNTLIRLHDKKKFYKLYEVIEYIEKNVLLNVQKEELFYNELGIVLNEKREFYHGDNKTKEQNIVNTIWEAKQGECPIGNIEEEKNGDLTKDNVHNNIYKHLSKSCIAKDTSHLMKKKKIACYENRNEKMTPNIYVINEGETKNCKNGKKKNEVKKLKKEIKKIKEEMVKLKETNCKEKCVTCYQYPAEGEFHFGISSKDRDSGKGEKMLFRRTVDVVKKELLHDRAHSLLLCGREDDINEMRGKEFFLSKDFHDDQRDGSGGPNGAQELGSKGEPHKEGQPFEKGASCGNSFYNSEAQDVPEVGNPMIGQCKGKEQHEKKKCIEIAMSSINQAQECLLNIKKKKMTSYLNRIINLSIRDQAIYISNDETELVHGEYRNLQKCFGKNYAHNCFDHLDNTRLNTSPVMANRNGFPLRNEKENMDTTVFITREEAFDKDILANTSRKQSKKDMLEVVNKKFKLCENAHMKNYTNNRERRKVTGMKKKKKKGKSEQITTLCFNIPENSSKVIYNYNMNYKHLLKQVIFIQQCVKKWIEKRKIWKVPPEQYHSYGSNVHKLKMFNYANLSGSYTEKDDANREVEDEEKGGKKKRSRTFTVKRHNWSGEYFSNGREKDVYEPHACNMEDKNGRVNGRNSLGLKNEKKEKDVPLHNMRNAEYIFKKMNYVNNKYKEYEMEKKYNKKENFDKFDNFPFEKYAYEKNQISQKREDIEMIKQIYDIKSNEINVEHDQVLINKNNNVYDVLRRYKHNGKKNDRNNNCDNLQKREQLTIDFLRKYSQLKHVEKKKIIDKKDIFLKLVNNLKFDNILNESKKNCTLKINSKNNSLLSPLNSCNNYTEKYIQTSNVSNGIINSIYRCKSNRNSNPDSNTTKFTQINFLNNDDFFYKNMD